ncbi:MAG: hypothetical protein ACKVJK_03130 [Methylophagaceae bacterium]
MSRGMGIGNPMWFVGVVEDNDDPTKQGRVKVRAFGVHGENTDEEIPTGALPWAVCVAGNYEPNNPPPKLNSFVFGMFLDGDEAQHPMIMGLIPAQYTEKHDPDKDKWGVVPGDDAPLRAQGLDPESFGMTQMSRLGRAEDLAATYITPQFSNAITKQKIADSELTWDEPPPAYGAKYPHNRVIETARHSIEIDDTPGAERIHIHHMSGSYIEIDATGSVKERADGDRYEVTIGTKHESSAHNVVTINGNSHVYVKGNKTEEIMGDYKQIVHGEHEVTIGGSSFYNVGSHLNMRGANIKLEGNADRVTIFGKNEVQIEAEKQINSVSLNIKNTALNTFDIYSNKAIKLTTPMDIHLTGSNIINNAAGLIPPKPLSGGVGASGFSVNALQCQFTSATGSFSGLWNAGAVNTAALLATTLSATTGNFGTLNTAILAAPLPTSTSPGTTCAVTVSRLVAITAPTVTIPALMPAALSNPIAAPLPGVTSGWAYPTGNGPLFATAVLTSPFSVITGINPVPGGGLGLPRIQMPEPASYGKTIVSKGYFALGYALGFISPLDDSADGDFNG